MADGSQTYLTQGHRAKVGRVGQDCFLRPLPPYKRGAQSREGGEVGSLAPPDPLPYKRGAQSERWQDCLRLTSCKREHRVRWAEVRRTGSSRPLPPSEGTEREGGVR
jgi:hypothetical protein